MTIFYVLVSMSVLFLLLAAVAFIWSVNNRQMEDLEQAGQTILFDDTAPSKPDNAKADKHD